MQFEEPWFGGVLSTAGNLVLQGTAQAELVAYRADTGERLWAAPTQAGVLAPPISYEVGGEQFIALEVGWGGAFELSAADAELVRAYVIRRAHDALDTAQPAGQK